MRRVSKKFLDAVVAGYSRRRLIAWLATKLRQRKRLQRIVKRFNPLKDPWAHGGDAYEVDRDRYAIDFKALLQRPIAGPIGLVAQSSHEVVKCFVEACHLLGADYELFDPARSDFLDQVEQSPCVFYVSRPDHARAVQRDLFMEKEVALRGYLGKRVFPTVREHEIYERKRVLAYFLRVNGLPHPRTFITYSREEAFGFLEGCSLPQVFKTTNGASSTGVEIIRTRAEGRRLVQALFDSHYVNKALIDYRDIDYGYVFLQEFIPSAREFRVIQVGDSWFGHEKAKSADQDFMSGSGVNLWTPPPLELLDFCWNIARRFSFIVMCYDVFMDQQGRYSVNELQTWFGSYNPSQMYLDGVPGRYRRIEGRWAFEPGLFNEIQSIPLRLVAYINQGA